MTSLLQFKKYLHDENILEARPNPIYAVPEELLEIE